MNAVGHDRRLAKLLQTVGVLCAVYEAGSFSAAAERLDLDQSAVSHKIRALESVLGVKLFERTTRRVRPTRAGAILCDAAQKVASEMKTAMTAAHEIHTETSIRLSVASALAMKWLLPLLRDGQREGLDLTFDVREDLAELDEGGVDAVIRFGPGPYPGYHSTRLAPCFLQPVASPAYLASLESKPHDISEEGLICLADRRGELDGTGFSWAAYGQVLGYRPDQPRTLRYFDRADLMLQASIAEMGVGLGRTLLIEEDIRQGLLVKIGPAAKITSAYWLVTTYELADSERVKKLKTWLARQIDQTLSNN